MKSQNKKMLLKGKKKILRKLNRIYKVAHRLYTMCEFDCETCPLKNKVSDTKKWPYDNDEDCTKLSDYISILIAKVHNDIIDEKSKVNGEEIIMPSYFDENKH